MTFKESVNKCFSKYVTFSGRAQRSEYWWWALFIFLGSLLFSVIDGAIFGFGEFDGGVLAPLFSFATFLPSLAVAARRLHDRDMSAWFLLLLLIPLLGVLALLIIFVLEGTRGPNRFGPDPLATGSGAAMGGTGVPQSAGRSPSVWDKDDDSFTASSVPKSGKTPPD